MLATYKTKAPLGPNRAHFLPCCTSTAADVYLTHSASEDIPRADEVRVLVKDVWDLRLAKLKKSIDIMIAQQETYGKVGGV